MGQKTSPIGFRLIRNKKWRSVWFANKQEFGSQLPVKQAVVKNIPVKQVLPQNSQPVQTTVLNTNEKVLSETTQAQNSIEPQKKTGISNLPSKIVNSVLYGYDDILQGIIYGFSLIIIGILMTLIFFNFNIKFKKALVLRAVVVIVLLSLATLVNKETIIAFIPHQILI